MRTIVPQGDGQKRCIMSFRLERKTGLILLSAIYKGEEARTVSLKRLDLRHGPR